MSLLSVLLINKDAVMGYRYLRYLFIRKRATIGDKLARWNMQ
ncbi:unnamed protein product [Callosobruchus maculatus]|uniref:Uncharacterized protein n=1 Tax=Callosobruchus maculatus TaxID=64391 RepID=A0A653CGS8_CALMS|nr:unnamed protein product [Callosobruchus maculatus]